jgi:hypothetical protein
VGIDLNALCLLDFPTDKNYRGLSLEMLQVTLCNLTVCVQKPHKDYYYYYYYCYHHSQTGSELLKQ